jgi:hypothetical protein
VSDAERDAEPDAHPESDSDFGAEHGGPRAKRDKAVRSDPPARPRTWGELSFRRQRSVRWFSPGVLAGTGLRVVLSAVFGAFLDKRELQAVTRASLHRFAGDALWLDFLADTGDGFDATYTMAWLASRPSLEVPGAGQALPRGRVLVLGGDEVYPTASPSAYEDRFMGPFTAALPWLPPSDGPEMFVLPGNHDWYDGLTSFIRTFCQKKWVGGWRTSQARSYFALALPHRWWLWGIDIQLDSYIDEPQLRYFERAANEMKPGDRVILCTATPSWVEADLEPDAYRNLAYLERALIRPAGARLMLTLTGDHHHYARYEGTGEMEGTHKVTAGGGGAFLHPTHDLRRHIALEVDKRDAAPQQYNRQACYPDVASSRRMAFGAPRLPFRNLLFMIVPAVAYVLLLWAGPFARTLEERAGRSLPDAAPTFGLGDLFRGLTNGPVSVGLLVVIWLGLFGFAKPPVTWRRGWRKPVAKGLMGSVHGGMQLVGLVAVAWLSTRIASPADGGWFTFFLLLAVATLGGLTAGLIMGVYLALCNGIRPLDTHGNEAFSAQRLTGHKNFLRLHIDEEGVLRLYPIGVEEANTKWRLDPDAGPSEPWISPDGEAPEVHLIEAPIVIDG